MPFKTTQRRHKATSKSSKRQIAVWSLESSGAVAIVAILAIAAYYLTIVAEPSGFTPVHVIKVQQNGPLPLTSLVASAKPTVVKGSCIAHWQLFKWSLKQWNNSLGLLKGVYHHNISYFGPYYDTSKPMASIARHPNEYDTNTSATVADILNNKPGSYRYLSQELHQLPIDLEAFMQPMNDLIALNPQRTSINLWIGQDVTAHAHYDGYHNMYCQLHGSKTFTLVSPKHWHVFGVYPFLHPSHAQTTANWSKPELQDKLKTLPKHDVYQVTLHAGDLLYLPPLWFHYVTAGKASISINAWTDTASEHAQRAHELTMAVLQAAKVDVNLRMITASLCQQVTTQVLGHSCQHVTQQLFQGRYNRSWTRAVLTMNVPKTRPAGCNVATERVRAEQVAGIVQAFRRLSASTHELWLGNWIEVLALVVVKDAKLVPQQLLEWSHCSWPN
eukprot:TRINITY_DN5022_c0_g1_i1.p1 TRINITY_DN5022_c0_g1~~TRINITY_DN5022_c0_g1_i1.p1  ORF type:complete len:444 (+),score=94.81 TRINITY_DN5022_c0_g1_i1:93-1424(+)